MQIEVSPAAAKPQWDALFLKLMPVTLGQEDTQIAMQRKWEAAGGVYLLVNKISDLRDYLRGEGLLL